MTNALIRPAWTPVTIAMMIIGFMIFWPLGLAMIAYIVWGDRLDQFKADVNKATDKASDLFGAALQRFNGHLPSWHRGIFYPEMLFALSDEARADLLLELDVDRVAAWFSMLDANMRARLLNGMPNALRASVQGVVFPSREAQLQLAEEGRQLLAKGFQVQLSRANLTFEDVVGGVA